MITLTKIAGGKINAVCNPSLQEQLMCHAVNLCCLKLVVVFVVIFTCICVSVSNKSLGRI